MPEAKQAVGPGLGRGENELDQAVAPMFFTLVLELGSNISIHVWHYKTRPPPETTNLYDQCQSENKQICSRHHNKNMLADCSPEINIFV